MSQASLARHLLSPPSPGGQQQAQRDSYSDIRPDILEMIKVMLMLMTKSIITMTIRRSRKQSWWSRTSTGASHQCLLYKGKDTPTRYIQVPGTWYQVPGTSSPLTFSILKTILNISCSQCGNSAGTKTLEWPRWSFLFSWNQFFCWIALKLACIYISIVFLLDLYWNCLALAAVFCQNSKVTQMELLKKSDFTSVDENKKHGDGGSDWD